MSRRPCTATISLFDWQPPQAVKRFEEHRVRSASLAGEVSRWLAETLSECEDDRPTIAQKMSDYLGTEISVNMLDKYASEAAEEHIINLVRFIALIIVTNDRAPLHHIAEKIGCIVIPAEYKDLIDLAQREENLKREERKVRALRYSAKKKGLL